MSSRTDAEKDEPIVRLSDVIAWLREREAAIDRGYPCGDARAWALNRAAWTLENEPPAWAQPNGWVARAAQASAPAWVPVTERLPEFPDGETSVECLVTTAHGSVTAMDWRYNQYAKTERGRAPRWEWNLRTAPWDVIAWQPLPAPYVPPQTAECWHEAGDGQRGSDGC